MSRLNNSFFPGQLDDINEVTDGLAESNILYSSYVNVVQDALVKIEEHVQFSYKSLQTYTIYQQTATLSFIPEATKDGAEEMLRFDRFPWIQISVDKDIAADFFGGTPFANTNFLFASALRWTINDKQDTGNPTRKFARYMDATVRVYDETATDGALVVMFGRPWVGKGAPTNDWKERKMGDFLVVNTTIVK